MRSGRNGRISQSRLTLVLVLAAGGIFFSQGAGAGVIVVSGVTISANAGFSFAGTVATFTDSDVTLTASNYTASINWGDLSSSAGTVTGGSGSFTVTGSHTYSSSGSFAVIVTITVPNIFVAQLAGSQEVPPNASPATGAGSVVLNGAQTQFTANLSFSGLLAPATAAHIHGPAPAGVNAAVLFPFVGVPAATSGTVPPLTSAITPTQLAQLQGGLFYMNVHSSQFPGGEIRGQLGVETATAQSTASVAVIVVPTLGGTALLTLIALIAATGVLVLGHWRP